MWCSEASFSLPLATPPFLPPSFLLGKKFATIMSPSYPFPSPSLARLPSPSSLGISPKARPLRMRESRRLPCVAPLKPHVPSPPPKFGCIRDRQFMRKCYVLEGHSAVWLRGDTDEGNEMYGRGWWEVDEVWGLRWCDVEEGCSGWWDERGCKNVEQQTWRRVKVRCWEKKKQLIIKTGERSNAWKNIRGKVFFMKEYTCHPGG